MDRFSTSLSLLVHFSLVAVYGWNGDETLLKHQGIRREQEQTRWQGEKIKNKKDEAPSNLKLKNSSTKVDNFEISTEKTLPHTGKKFIPAEFWILEIYIYIYI